MGKDLLTVVGASASRIDGVEKVTGQAKFTGDFVF
jgi:CO/xanthine dehydrogenase Mo-binding subunit